MTGNLVHAFTALGATFPPYINVSRLADGSVKVIVRSPPRMEEQGHAGEWAVEGATASMVLSEADWRSLAWSIYAENEDRMRDLGRPVPHHGSGPA